ncbi:MAG: hypothetical protein AAGB00_01640 [Planctomycetota bacterium]
MSRDTGLLAKTLPLAPPLIAFALLCVPSTATAKPTLDVDPLGINAEGNLEWLVSVSSGDEGSIAIELGFGFENSSLVEATLLNPSIFIEVLDGFIITLPANNPFTGGITEGLVVTGDSAFASFGSRLVPAAPPTPFLLFESEGPMGTLKWGDDATAPFGGGGDRIFGGDGEAFSFSGSRTVVPEPATAGLCSMC